MNCTYSTYFFQIPQDSFSIWLIEWRRLPWVWPGQFSWLSQWNNSFSRNLHVYWCFVRRLGKFNNFHSGQISIIDTINIFWYCLYNAQCTQVNITAHVHPSPYPGASTTTTWIIYHIYNQFQYPWQK